MGAHRRLRLFHKKSFEIEKRQKKKKRLWGTTNTAGGVRTLLYRGGGILLVTDCFHYLPHLMQVGTCFPSSQCHRF
ncbi:hypothetical protein, unlikely [Trypanosoma brucei brucei TREU927]|uniref:Uncharacterized protein n=1 Tax=Trypanosoma brucei brucei (strain 927/4 GUTat10.1) TaxID=185431 RepID=Q4GYL1_TRYB2|nr:hypothetical protein, unlikely [Trypanosoma brucei brucei TREU927]CAJ16573.1 hypothetical protein, unlikely [Trypanosoma brucei brucei TREU927]